MATQPVKTQFELAVAAHVEQCRSFGHMPDTLKGMTAPGFEEFPLEGEMLKEVNTCIRQRR